MLYFCSPYYRSNKFSGANKRFEELILEFENLSVNYKLIVVSGNVPPNINNKKCIFIPFFISNYRLLTWLWLNIILLYLPKGIVINDFKPIPVLSYFKHKSYLLIHDLRKIIANNSIKGFQGLVQILMMKIFPQIITVSNYSKNLLVKTCGIKESNIIVSYNGVSKAYTEYFDEVFRDIDILYVAHFEARKRHKDLLNAIIKYQVPLSILLVGVDHGEFNNLKPLISKAKTLGHKLIVKTNVSEIELIQLYRKTKIYVFPSEVEGFGMPLIEAVSQGCKVVCSDLDVFKEVCGNAYFFKLKDVDSLLTKLTQALTINLVDNPKNIEERFLWNTIAITLLNDIGYNRVDNGEL